jgi:hypothetical protein
LIVTEGPPVNETLDHVGIERALREVGAADLLGLGLEHVDEGLADELALGFGIGRAFKAAQEHLGDVGMDERDVVVVAEQRDDLFGLAQTHQAMVDEDAGELVADRLVDQHGGHGGVDATRKAADHARVAHLGADFGDLGLAEFGHRPVAGAAADVTHEIGDQLAAVGRVDDFGMELGAVVLLFVIGDDGEGAPSETATMRKPGRTG